MKIIIIFFGFLYLSACKKTEVAKSVEAPTLIATEQESRIAILNSYIPEVQFRRAEKLEWLRVEDKMGFKALDSVKTQKAAGAVISFNDRTILNVKENSLVVLVDYKSTPQLDETTASLKEGKLEAKLSADSGKDQSFLLKTKQAWIRTQKKAAEKTVTSVQAEIKNETELEVKASSGEMQIISAEKTQTIPEGRSVKIIANEAPSENKNENLNQEKPPAKIIIRLSEEKSSDAGDNSAYFFKVLSTQVKKEGAAYYAELKAECSSSYQAFFKNKAVSDEKGRINEKIKLKRGLNNLSIMLVNNKNKDVKYESIEISTDE